MDIGISMGATHQLGDFSIVAQKIEELGFDSVWLPEHPVIPVNHNTKYPGTPDGSIPKGMTLGVNPLIALATAVSTTEKLGLGTGVNLITEHNPIDLAKQISTLDFYSGGRFMFGIGTGWFREESEIMGADFDHRWTQAREYVLAMKELWTKQEAEYHGQYVDFPPVILNPKPARKPHPPVYLGGNAKNVLKRVVRWGEGWLPNAVNPDGIKAARATLAELCDSAERDPDSIGITIHSQPADKDLINRFEEAGAERVLLRVGAADQEGALNELEELAGVVFN
jgi:probable F420-dependent oxidoreductase